MNLGINENNERVEALPNIKDITCELCGGELIAKCGEIKVWHFAHKSNIECDDWCEPESEWHLNWKKEFPKEQQEVIVKRCISDYCNNPKYEHNHKSEFHSEDNCPDCKFKKHRADIKTKNNLVIELQNSPISSEEITERENFYDNMIWVLNGETFAKNLNLREKKGIFTFRWKYPPKSWSVSKKPIFIQLIGKTGDGYFNGKQLFLIKKIHWDSKFKGGWGILLSKEEFLNLLKEDNSGK